MDEFLDNIPLEFWRTYGSARYTQLRWFGWDGQDAFHYAVNEVEARKKIERSWGAEHAIFAVKKIVEYPLSGDADAYFKPLTKSPFPRSGRYPE